PPSPFYSASRRTYHSNWRTIASFLARMAIALSVCVASTQGRVAHSMEDNPSSKDSSTTGTVARRDKLDGQRSPQCGRDEGYRALQSKRQRCESRFYRSKERLRGTTSNYQPQVGQHTYQGNKIQNPYDSRCETDDHSTMLDDQDRFQGRVLASTDRKAG